MVEAVGDANSDPHALVHNLADPVPEVDAVTHKRGDAHPLIDTLADTVAEMEAKTLADTRAMRTDWSTLWLTR